MKSADLSWQLLVRNEAELLPKLFERMAPMVEEIIVIDTGSTDDTMEIARVYTTEVYSFELNHSFSAARNFGLGKVTKPWVLQVDADEWPTDALLRWLKEWESKESPFAVMLQRHNLVGGQHIGANTYEWLTRLFPSFVRYVGRIHESPHTMAFPQIRAPEHALLLHHKSVARQERQNAFYMNWEEQRAIINNS